MIEVNEWLYFILLILSAIGAMRLGQYTGMIINKIFAKRDNGE